MIGVNVSFFILDVSAVDQPDLLAKKVAQCANLFNFLDPVSDMKSKEIKRACLAEIIDYITVNRGVLAENLYGDIVKMVRKLFFFFSGISSHYRYIAMF